MKHHRRSEATAIRQEHKLAQAGFSDAQVSVLHDLVEDLVTKEEFHEFRKETREGFVRIEARLDTMATREELAKVEARLDNTATKEDIARIEARLDTMATQEELAKVEAQLDNTATKEDIARIEARLDTMATREELTKIEARLDNAATKNDIEKIQAAMVTREDLDRKFFQLLLFFPLITVSIVGVTLAVGVYLSKVIA